ncbi:hypothetical protein CVU75_01030 [Candidatus Dependentiae bacterium HGW-Dependentiae-1]|nr:MAG: hypothetical protein CVU75_01030 [Candidatus Dependentiae bacterium HGW-Dependentiae-1]
MRFVYFYGAALLCVFTLGYLSVKKVTRELSVVNAYVCHFSSGCSESIQEKIKFYVASAPQFVVMPLASVVQTIRQEFPCLKKISCAKDATKIVHLTCESARPLFFINDAYVLADTDCVLTKDCFSPADLALLPAIAVATTQNGVPVLSVQAKRSLRDLDPVLFDRYLVTWVDDTQVWLREKELATFSLVFQANLLPDRKIMDECGKIKKEFESSGLIVPQGKKRWVADMRFANQIILSANTGGSYYG